MAAYPYAARAPLIFRGALKPIIPDLPWQESFHYTGLPWLRTSPDIAPVAAMLLEKPAVLN